MMNQLYSKTRFIKNNVDFNFNLNNIKKTSYKKDELFFVKDGDLNKKNEIIYNSKNIFTTYSDDAYNLYKEISILLNEACSLYEINKNVQNYMIYGKVSKYGKDNMGVWYDFPGINIPYLHGFFFFGPQYEISFKNQIYFLKVVLKALQPR